MSRPAELIHPNKNRPVLTVPNWKSIGLLYPLVGFSSEAIKMVAVVNESECVACGACVDVCPEGAITCDDIAVIDAGKCVDCGACVDECPSSAISD